MRLSDWQTVNRLLLFCGFDQTAAAQLEPAIQALNQNLSRTAKNLLFCGATGYEFSTSPFGYINNFIDVQDAIPYSNSKQLIAQITRQRFDAAIIFTEPKQSPYSLAYLCYLAKIPIRLGQSLEFGGGVLSTWIKPPIEPVSLVEYHLHLLQSINFNIKKTSFINFQG